MTSTSCLGEKGGKGRNHGSKASPLHPQPPSQPRVHPSGGCAGGFGPELDLYELGSLSGGWGSGALRGWL